MSDLRLLVERELRRPGLAQAATAVAVSSPTAGMTWAWGALPDGTRMTGSTPLYAASVTKQVTAALAARRVLAGELDPSEGVRTHLPGLPRWAEPVRVLHLVHHTSGLPGEERIAAALGLVEEQLDNALVLRGLALLEGPEQGAGQAFTYNNAGYVVLAEVVRAVTGTDLAELAAREVFGPLGMSRTHLGGSPDAVLPGLPPPPRTLGDGGLWTTAEDLLRWLEALNRGALGRRLTRLLQTPGHLQDTTPVDYAWGAAPRPALTGTTYVHGGSWPGWAARTLRNPAAGTAVALLTTCPDADVVSSAATAVHDVLVAESPFRARAEP